MTGAGSSAVPARSPFVFMLVVLAGCGSSTLGGGGGDASGVGGAPTGAGGGRPGGTGGILAGTGGGGSGGLAVATGGFGDGAVATGGMAGVAGNGVSGTSGGGTTGSPDPCLPVPTAVNCGGGLCGNGVRDTCVLRGAFDRCPEVKVTETCDGTDVGAVTCRDFGFGGGTPSCSYFCQTIGSDGCRECHDLDGQLISCGPVPLAAGAYGVAIAAADSEIGVGWIEQDEAGQETLGFARLTPSLATVTSTRLRLDQGDSTTMVASVAPLPSGWAVVGTTQTVAEVAIFVQVFDASGRQLSRTTLEVLPDGWESGPLVAARADGGPMVFWATRAKIRATLIAADGRSSTAPFDVSTFDPEGFTFDAAYAGNAFYVMDGELLPNDVRQLRLTRIEPDGRVNTPVPLLPGVNAHGGMLVRGASDLRVIYTGSLAFGPDATLQVRQVAETGAPTSAPVALPGWTTRGVAFGGDTALWTFEGYPLSMGLVRAARDGSVTMFRPIASSPFPEQSWIGDIARRGPDAVVAWLSTTGDIQLARVAN